MGAFATPQNLSQSLEVPLKRRKQKEHFIENAKQTTPLTADSAILPKGVPGPDVFTSSRSQQDSAVHQQLTAARRANFIAAVSAFCSFATICFLAYSTVQTRRALMLDQRAWVGATETSNGYPHPDNVPSDLISLGRHTTLVVIVTNTGKTPAFDLHTSFRIETAYVDKPFAPDYSIQREQQGQTVLQPGMHVYPNATEGRIVDTQELEQLRAGQLRLYFYGLMQYKDVFGLQHETRFCSFVLANLKNIAECEHFNSED